MAPPAIPIEVGDLSPSWLTGVLRTHAPGVTVASVDTVAAHSGTTGRVKLRLHYQGDRGELPDTVFCKIAPFDLSQRELLRQFGIGAMEARFYAALGSRLPVRAPRTWHAEADDKGGFVMVLEDLDATGCRYPRPSDPDIGERAASTVEELGHLHGMFWEDPSLAAGELDWVPERAGFGGGGGKDPAVVAAGATRFVKPALAQFSDKMPPAFEAVGTLFVGRAADILDLWDEGERTLIHGDPHSGNLFTDRGRTGFFDWAMFSRSPGMRDVAYYCCNSLPTEVRRRDQGDLLARYRQALVGHGVHLNASLAEQQYRLFSVFSWLSAASTAAMGSQWQPSERAVAALERATAAVDDLDAVGLLHELLG